MACFDRERLKDQEIESSLDEVAWLSHTMIIYTLDCRSSRCAILKMLMVCPEQLVLTGLSAHPAIHVEQCSRQVDEKTGYPEPWYQQDPSDDEARQTVRDADYSSK